MPSLTYDSVVQRLATRFAAVFDPVDEQEPTERVMCAAVCELLQRVDGLVAINEPPYADGRANDARCDLKVYFGANADVPMWVEVKPILAGSNYLNYSKFFNGSAQRTHIHRSSSCVLDDIDKLARIARGKNAAAAFALVMRLDGKPLDEDRRVPRPGTQLTPGQILTLAKRRFTSAIGRSPDLAMKQTADGNVAAIVLAVSAPTQ